MWIWWISKSISKYGLKAFDKKIELGAIATSKAEVNVNEQLIDKLHKPITKKLRRRKIYAEFRDSIWAGDEMESLSSKNENVKYLLCVIDFFTKYAWVKPLKDKKIKQFLML